MFSCLVMMYFAYGSNMCIGRMKNRIPGAASCCTAVLAGYTIKFHTLSPRDGSGKCNAFETRSALDVVYGVIYKIAPEDKPLLDRYEGLGVVYALRNVVLECEGACIEAFTYAALPEAIDDMVLPFAWYKYYVLTGAKQNNFPASYIERIESVYAVEDPDMERDRVNREIAGMVFA